MMTKTYFLDTNIIISLAKYHKCKNVKQLMKSDHFDYYKASAIERLYNLIQEGKIRAVICPLVLDEILQGVHRFGEGNVEYLRESKVIVIDKIDEKRTEIINKLANHYFKHTCRSGEKAFDICEHKYNGKNDAYIMAFASVLGVDIITFDKHFTGKIFSIQETNSDFYRNYVIPNKLKDEVSPNCSRIKVHKPTHIIKNEFSKM